MKLALALALLLLIALGALAQAEVVASFPFEGSLKDASPFAGQLQGQASYAPGHTGQCLSELATPLVLESQPELCLSAGFSLDCWIYFDEVPTTHTLIAIKDQEYQLRLDPVSEGGRLAFFVYLNEWEPRLGAPRPKPRVWNHIIASWDGVMARLEINGEVWESARTGYVNPTDNPLELGGQVKIDEFKVINLSARLGRDLLQAAEGSAASERLAFSPEAGWGDWQASAGGKLEVTPSMLRFVASEQEALLYTGGLAVDVTERPLISLLLKPTGQTTYGRVVFVTDRGLGEVSFPVREGQSSVADLSGCANWKGRLKALAVGLLPPGPGGFDLEGLWIGDELQGPAFVYPRSFTTYRAVLRAGREETLIAIVRNSFLPASEVRVTLELPPGITALDGLERSVPALAAQWQQRLEWKVRADQPVKGEAVVRVSAAGRQMPEKPLTLDFKAPVAPADYVPAPKPAKTDYTLLMHYCALWKDGTHLGWNRIENYPERRPAIGFYNEGEPEVADWHIKYALEHGIQGFVYCWYRSDLEPEIHQMLGHAIHDGLKQAVYRDQFKYAIMWENANAKGIVDLADLLDNLLPFWIENYFKDSGYVRLDGKPLLVVYYPPRLREQLGGSAGVKAALTAMRKACQEAGLGGLYIMACEGTANEANLQQFAAEGWDATSAYATFGPWNVTKPDQDGGIENAYRPWVLGQMDIFKAKRQLSTLPDIVNPMMGWDPRPWHGELGTHHTGEPDAAAFKELCQQVKVEIDSRPASSLDSQVVLFDNWTEFGEGHYIEPTSGTGFDFLNAIRDVFCDPASPPADQVIPEDLGLEPRESWYMAKRPVFLSALADKSSVMEEGLLAHWAFNDPDPVMVRDSSPCKLEGFLNDCEYGAGVEGGGLVCTGDAVEIPFNRLLMPQEGLTLSLWVNPSVADQSDNWLLTCLSGASTGWRLGLGSENRMSFQVPITDWSHGLGGGDPLPVGKWTHVAASFDGQTMRLFVAGKEVASLPRQGAIRPATSSLFIGGFSRNHPTANYLGTIDEVKVWVRALPPAEIAAEAARFGD